MIYKLTDHNGQSFGGTQWGPGVTHSGTGEGDLCSEGWIHAYEDKYMAALMNPIHANFKNPTCWIAQGSGKTKHGGQLKIGYKTLTTIRKTKLPHFTLNQRIAFAIYCAQAVIGDKYPEWSTWAENWLSGKDRSRRAAWTAATASVATTTAAWAAAYSAAAARAAYSAAAARAAYSAAAAAWAAEEAAAAGRAVNLPSLARKAYKFERNTK